MTATCAHPGCTDPAVSRWGCTWCGRHDEERELEYELTLDASGFGHTDVVHQIAERAAHNRLEGFTGADGDLANIGAARAALIATSAVLETLDTAGHLVPEGATVTKAFRILTDDEQPVTDVMGSAEFESWMKARGLSDGEHVVALRTISTPIPRDLVLPVLEGPVLVSAEADF